MPQLVVQPSDVLLRFPISSTANDGAIFSGNPRPSAIKKYTSKLLKRIYHLRACQRKVQKIVAAFDQCIKKETITLARLRSTYGNDPRMAGISFVELRKGDPKSR